MVEEPTATHHSAGGAARLPEESTALMARNTAPREAGRPVTYWHGGVPGLRVGDYLLPRSVTRTRSYADIVQDYVGSAEWVHITIDKDFAAFHASAYVNPDGRPGGGSLYAVRPGGRPQPDPDDVPGQSFTVRRARVIRVAQTGVELSPLEGQRAQRGHSVYVDGSEMYDPDGWQLAQNDRVHLPEVQHQLALENEFLLLVENRWRVAHGRPVLPRPPGWTTPPDFDAYRQTRTDGAGQPIRLV